MDFVASKILWILAAPSTLLPLIGWLGLMGVWLRRRRLGLALIAVSLGCLLLVRVLPVGEWLLAPLEDRFPRVSDPPARVDGIIVLGGALDPELTAAHGIPALNDGAERMTTFVALARRYPQAQLAFTGGNGLLLHGTLSEADGARMLFEQLGLARPVTYENRSRTTWENAVFLRAQLAPRPGQIWVLITSASHMPRAVGIFRSLGWPVLPWPVGYKTGASAAIEYQEAMPRRLGELDLAAHEWLGLLANRLMGRTSDLLPSPAEPQ